MQLIVRGAIWFGLYIFLVLFPLLIGAMFHPAGVRSFSLELGVACGYVGLAIMGFQFALISRIKWISGVFGQDALEQFHRQIGFVAVMFVVAHPVLLLLSGYPWLLLNPFWDGNLSMWRWGEVALYGLLLLVFLAAFRKTLKIPYEWWQSSHGLISTAVVLFALIHTFMIGNYSATRAMRALWALYMATFIGVAIWYRIVRPISQWQRPWKVTRNISERGNARTLVLHPDGHPGFAFEPGQFAWLTMGASPFHFEQHPISISSSAEIPAGGDIAFTIKALGDWSGKVVPSVKPGTRVWVDGPYGVFSIDREQGPGYVLIGGGVGIAPLRSMCETLAAREDVRPVVLFYGCRDNESLTFREEFDALTTKMNLKIVYILEHPSAAWTEESGLIDASILRRHLPAQYRRFQYFVCGPAPMMDAMERLLPEILVPRSQVHTERFEMA
ncbi:MAG: ferric reductase-like transmembrane domain-containing protein [Terracidiphilus sp.]